jgi:hypothetical protein
VQIIPPLAKQKTAASPRKTTHRLIGIRVFLARFGVDAPLPEHNKSGTSHRQ